MRDRSTRRGAAGSIDLAEAVDIAPMASMDLLGIDHLIELWGDEVQITYPFQIGDVMGHIALGFLFGGSDDGESFLSSVRSIFSWQREKCRREGGGNYLIAEANPGA